MKERPIPFSAPMVRALRREVDPKTQTRRLVKGLSKKFPLVPLCRNALVNDAMAWGWKRAEDGVDAPLGAWLEWCPYGVAGDRLWVREAWRIGKGYDGLPGSEVNSSLVPRIHYEADGAAPAFAGRYRHGRFMPRWACRMVLEVVGVRVERLQDIDENDAEAEGCEEESDVYSAVRVYRDLWDSLNAERAPWASNPFVWVVEFKRSKP